MHSYFKMSCAGNDYLYTLSRKPSRSEIIAVCNRYSGIGSDGVVVIYKKGENFGFKIYNADASHANFCGNACMCVAKYLFDNGLVDKKRFEIITDSGIKRVFIEGKKVCKSVRLEVGKPSFSVSKNLFSGGKTINKLITLENNGKKIRVRGSVVDVGNLHFVVTNVELNNFKMKLALNAISQSELFKNGVNVEFVNYKKYAPKVVVFERGSGRTLSCASGACAVFWAIKNANYGVKNLKLLFEGGVLEVKYIGGKVNVLGKPRYEKIKGGNSIKW